MKKQIIIFGLLLFVFTSCESFLAEEPESFLTPGQFYSTPEQIQVAVNGAYYGKGEFGGDPTDSGIAWPYLSTFLGLPISEYLAFESLTGMSINEFGSAEAEEVFERMGDIPDTNPYLSTAYNGVFIPLENVNSVIANIAETTVIDATTRDRYLAQMYFLRAYLYFHGVRLFGPIPLKTTPTNSISEVAEMPKATVEAIYNQIETDLETAETMGLPWVDTNGYADLGAVKALLAEVYLTRAGYPLQETEYYEQAYNKALEVINSGEYELFEDYEDLRNPATFNQGEHIFMIQREANVANNPLHYDMSPGPQDPIITVNQDFEPALTPTVAFYNSYDAGDLRTEDFAYFYEFSPGQIMNYKYWDEAAAQASPSGANIPIMRYADVLLTCAEAKAAADGGATSDAAAIDAYHQVRGRAFSGILPPASISVDDVLKERFWEQSFEYKIWFTQTRTRRTLDTGTSEMVDLIGHVSTNHIDRQPVTMDHMTLPLPYQQKLLNPLLEEEPVDPSEQQEG